MFYYLEGTVTLMEPGLAVIDCGGVGYACSTTTYTLAGLKLNARARLYTYCSIREDAFDIYGFSTKDERDCFLKLLAVSGVGPKAALSILSILSPDQFRLAVITQDERSLTRAAGVGKKVAQRILLELKEKLGAAELPDNSSGGGGVTLTHGSAVAEATAALGSLGYSQAEIGAALKTVEGAETLTAEQLVRQALRAMVTK